MGKRNCMGLLLAIGMVGWPFVQPRQAHAAEGIAAKYQQDAGIEKDQAVIFAEGFEGSTRKKRPPHKEIAFMRIVFLCSSLAALCPLCPLLADDWPQWLGPHRDSVWREEGIVGPFPREGLLVKWRTPVALGCSGPGVANGRLYAMGMKGRDT
jgi:hypothetical protein